ncbi:MAG: hypothetical protein UV78_C0053G0007 [Parcubacteria group bacterium GW2011_GWA2_43_17]|nr:MAG: hypothetical protein UV78_C0053G0007 [Parcubacteria group bacterium GW2011_GWA2_43_17]KKT92124.1 MAG: hypothetical protein UW91_C0026G0008 [Parcubacteria group bacterium GW2011_GWF2_45_11]KKT97380.1 MAG: hypothetical protein UW98_C0018G0007 [Parcubacteria group bacterium GW2011_GWC2_45_15]
MNELRVERCELPAWLAVVAGRHDMCYTIY